MDRHRKLAVALALAATACPAGPKEQPPPDEGAALASAAPGALGALAAGTDAAPPAVLPPRVPMESPEGIPMPELEVDAGVEPEDAGGVGQGELPL
jgi:hypothetical protein